MIDARAVAAGRGLTERAACRRLSTLAGRVPPGQVVVELGAFRGRTTAWLALGAERGHGATVIAVDPWETLDPPDVDGYLEPQYARGEYADPDTFAAFLAHLDRCRVARRQVVVHKGTAAAAAAVCGDTVGLLFHDALHTAEAVRADLESWLPHMAPSCVVALHDAAEPRFGVVEGASVLAAHGFDWEGRKLYRWAKHPGRRGLLVVKRSPS